MPFVCVFIEVSLIQEWFVSKLTIIGSDNGLSPGRRQAIIRTNAGILLIQTLGTNSSEILSAIHAFSFKKIHLKNVVCKMASISSRPQWVKRWTYPPLAHFHSLRMYILLFGNIIPFLSQNHFMHCFLHYWFCNIVVRKPPFTVYHKKYAHGFVVLCFVVVMQLFIMNSHEVFIHIHQGCFAGTGAIVRLPQCQWSKPDGYGKISQCITTTKHSKAKSVCIFLGIYCIIFALFIIVLDILPGSSIW